MMIGTFMSLTGSFFSTEGGSRCSNGSSRRVLNLHDENVEIGCVRLLAPNGTPAGDWRAQDVPMAKRDVAIPAGAATALEATPDDGSAGASEWLCGRERSRHVCRVPTRSA